MKKSLVFAIVMLAIVGVMLVLSMDDDPPDDAHLILDEGATPTEGNGFYVLLDCLEIMDWPDDDAWVVSMPRRDVPNDAGVMDLLHRNEEALELMAEASDAPVFRVPPSVDLEPPAFVTRTRQLGHLVAVDATVRSARGDHRGAFARVFEYLELVQRFKSTGEMLHYLVGSGYQASSLKQILRLAVDSDGGELEAVVSRLETYAWERDAMENALRREYVFMTNVVDEPFQRAGSWKDVPVFGRYVYQRNRTRRLYLDTFDAAIDGMMESCATAPRESKAVEMPKWRYLGPNAAGRILHVISVPNLAQFTFSRCREQMSLGLTRLVLAARAYRADIGTLPVELDALVPRYLDELPVDVDSQPFRYSAAEEYLYSVGEDRLDYGGGEPGLLVDWNDPDPGVSLRR